MYDPRPGLAANGIQPIFQRSVVQILGQRIQRSVVRGQPDQVVTRFFGSGFIIHKKVQENKFLVITCRHVIEDVNNANNDEHLMVRLPGTHLDAPAYAHQYLKKPDVQVISVHVPPQTMISVNQFPCVVFSPQPAAVGTLVTLMGYYNPINLPLYLNRQGPLLAIEPSAYGGYIVGPPDHTEHDGIVVQHNCFGIRGASGGPLIRFDTHCAIGVFTGTTYGIGEAASTECVRRLLGRWLESNGVGINDTDTIQTRLDKCAELNLY
ncbi:hypothetical protein SETIT_5G012300v2 [Setaria italica]|uniref:Peptidase S1 domain-containing protein n=2 Tax=Setaria italica TaxID=4555 RepID=A0A368QZZ1_SETIT|nr:hypothetical protein SETIT_5G012300v2 [Setaria italica]RCV23516.1 hypothetical protein SETIT_5G012300v2 [Setaria italica]